jgi:hypothetical protein
MIPHQQTLVIVTPLKDSPHRGDQQNDRDQSQTRDNPHSSSLLPVLANRVLTIQVLMGAAANRSVTRPAVVWRRHVAKICLMWNT